MVLRFKRAMLVATMFVSANVVVGGCSSEQSAAPVPAPRPNYHEDIRPLLTAYCLDCHYPTETVTAMAKLAPYENAREAAPKMKHVLLAHEMPPWGLENSGSCRTWRNARWLDAAQIETMVKWIDLGAPEGDPNLGASPPPSRHVQQTLRHADVTLDTGVEYPLDLGERVVRCFVVDPQLAETRLLTALEVQPSKPWKVEQVSLYSLETDEAERAAEALDAADPIPGYACLADAKVDGAKFLVGSSWIDATSTSWVTRLPDGLGVRIPAARKMVMQVHYNLIAGMDPERSRVRLELDALANAGGTAREACWQRFSLDWFLLEPGNSLTSAYGSLTVPRDLEVFAAYPRMRFQGRKMNVAADSACLADMFHWDQHGLQHLYEYEQPPKLRAGEQLRLTCSYTTLGKNDPVVKGAEAENEECTIDLLSTPCP